MTDEEAVYRCQKGDREAFGVLVERYKNVMYGTAYLMTHNASVAEEVVQEAFLSAWKGINNLRVEKSAKPWFMRILVNKVIDLRRHQVIQAGSLDPAPHMETPDPQDGWDDSLETRDRVRQALESVSEDHKQIVLLRYFSDLSVPEIAKVLGCQQGTVKSRLHRALQHMKSVLKQQ